MKEVVKKRREELREQFKKDFNPRGDGQNRRSMFDRWCRMQGIDPWEQTLGGKAYSRYNKVLDEEYAKDCQRIDLSVGMMRLNPPAPHKQDNERERKIIEGWNACLTAVIKLGRIPQREEPSSKKLEGVFYEEGWNSVVDVLEIRFKHIFK